MADYNNILSYIRTRENLSANPLAKNPRSSASGEFQFTNGTYINTVRKMDPRFRTVSDKEILAMKNGTTDEAKMFNEKVAQYSLQSEVAPILQKAGVEVNQQTAYLGWFAGPQKAVEIMKADPNTPIKDILSPEAISANRDVKLGEKSFAQFTAGDMVAWSAQKTGGQPTGSALGTGGGLDKAPQQAAPQVQQEQPDASIFTAPPEMPENSFSTADALSAMDDDRGFSNAKYLSQLSSYVQGQGRPQQVAMLPVPRPASLSTPVPTPVARPANLGIANLPR